MNRFKALMLVAACLLSFPAASLAQQAPASAPPIVIKFSHVVATDTPKGKAAERFKQLAEERTGGKVRVEIYPNSQLYKDKEEVEALQLGAVQMLAPTSSKFGPLGVPEFEVFDLPFMFPSRDALHRVTEGPIGAEILKRLEPHGIIGLAYWDNGFKNISANKPLLKPEDVRGLKMRIQSSRVLHAQMRALKANPQVTAMAEVYQALQTGVVDGTENVWSNMYTLKFHEVQRHATLTNHGYIGYAVIVNKAFWDGLPPDIRALLEQAMRETTTFANQIAQKENDDALAAIRASGLTTVHELTIEQREVWRQALLPVHVQMEARVGKDLIDAIRKVAEAEIAGEPDVEARTSGIGR
jgi:C4-dicarboxylate-binding protein DctP